MPKKIKLISKTGITAGKAVFKSLDEYEPRVKLLAQVLRSEMMNQRSGNAHTKNRGEVSGTGKKPWRQKGTGRARHGSRRSPIWVGGGVAHGPRNTVNWHRKINKSSRVAALKSLIVDRLKEDTVYQFDEKLDLTKTKSALEILTAIDKKDFNPKEYLVFYTTEDKPKTLGLKNLGVSLINAKNLKLFKLAQKKSYIFTPSALNALEERLTK